DRVSGRARPDRTAHDLCRHYRQREPGSLHGPDRHDAAALRLGRRPDAAGLSGPGLGRFLYPLDPLTERTITDPEALRERLAAIRRDGFAISIGETVPGAAGVAAPIFNADGSVSAGLLIGAPIDRFEQELPELKRLLREATMRAAGIAQALVEDGSRG